MCLFVYVSIGLKASSYLRSQIVAFNLFFRFLSCIFAILLGIFYNVPLFCTEFEKHTLSKYEVIASTKGIYDIKAAILSTILE